MWKAFPYIHQIFGFQPKIEVWIFDRYGRVEGYSIGNQITVHFHSSYYTQGGGFSCVAQALPNVNPGCDCGIKGQVSYRYHKTFDSAIYFAKISVAQKF